MPPVWGSYLGTDTARIVIKQPYFAIGSSTTPHAGKPALPNTRSEVELLYGSLKRTDGGRVLFDRTVDRLTTMMER
jgi:hypothetical protein